MKVSTLRQNRRKKATWLSSMLMLMMLFFAGASQGQIVLTENFESPTFPPAGWLVTNEGTGNIWQRSTSTSSPTNISGSTGHMRYSYNLSNPANTWAYTSALSLETGKTYIIDFFLAAASASYPERMKVTIGNAQTVAAQSTTLLDFPSYTTITQTKQGTTFTVPSTGTYYIAFNCYSIANQFNLSVDNISIREAVTVNGAPINFSATAVTASSMTVNWEDNSTNEVGFRVFRSTDDVNYTQVGADIPTTSAGTTGTAYNLPQTGLVPGQTYYYRIVSYADDQSAFLTGSQATSAAPVYTWDGSEGTVFGNADNWTPARTSPSNVDVLVFDGTTSTVTAVSTQTIGQLRVINGAVVSASSGASATLTISGGGGDDLDIQSGSSINFGGTAAMGIAFATGSHTANIAGTLQTSTTGTFTLNTTNSVMNVFGTLTLGAGTNNNTGAIGTRVFHPNAVCNINTNSINIPTATWDATATLNINGVVAATSPTITSGQSFGNINWNSTGQTGTFNLFSTSAYTIQGTLTITSTGTGKLRLSTSSSLTLNNIVVNGGTFELMNGAGTYTIGGNISQSGGSFDWNFDNSSGTVNLAGNVTRTAGTMIKTGTATGHFLVLNGTAAQTIDIPTTVVQSYRLNNASGLNVTGTLNINNSCSLDMRAGNILSGAVTYGATGTTLSYTGNSSQSATATEFPATGGPFNLTINNSGTAPNNVVTIPFDRSIGGTATGTVLNLTNGVLDNLGYTLTVLNTNTSAVTTVTSGGRYITGRLARVLPASLSGTNTYVFPVGKTTNNAFELINPTTNAGGTVTIVAEAFDGATGGNPGNSLSAINNARYWSTSISDGAANFTDTRIRLNDTRGSYDVIGGSATLTGDYELVGGFPATLTSTSIASVAPAVSSLGYYLMANPASPEISDITIDPATPQCTNVARTITATVEEGGAALTLVEIRYQVNGGSVQNVAMTNTSGDTWEGVIPTVTPANGTVTWSIYAEDAAALSKSEAGPSYKDEPLFGAVATANATPSTVCAGADVTLSYTATGLPTVRVGTGTLTSGSAAFSPYYHGWGGVKTQHIIRASELTAAGYTAGNFTALGFDVTSASSTLNGFAISMGHTAQDVATTTAISTGLINVYSNAAQPVTVGINNYVFTTPFTWDGTSNIVVSICYSNNNFGGTSGTVRYGATSFVSSMAIYDDNETVAAICAATTSTDGISGSSTTTSNRPNLYLTGPNNNNPTSYTWNDGTNDVGTGETLVVAPTTTTSYTLSIVYGNGCEITSAPVAVTVNPLPGAPTSAIDSEQCGLGVPGVLVSGALPGQYRWYLSPTGGTALPGETNQLLGSYSISTTTTFHVAISDGNCESARVPVTAIVNAPDAVDATVVSSTVCVNSPLDLTAVQTGSNQTYTYTWTAVPEAGSGITGSEVGEEITVTPTTPGTYTYTVTAVDGGCTTTGDVVVTVVDLPSITTATATPATICNGGSSTLTATSVFSNAVTATLGTGTITNSSSSTTAAGYPAPFGNYYEGAKNQFLIKASELTAAGLSAGNLNSLAFDVVTPEVEPLQDFTIGMKQTTLSALSTMETGFTTVYSNASYVPSATGGFDNNTIIFDTPFAWDGTSDIVIETCFNNDDFTSNAVFNQSTTAYVSSLVYRADGISGLCSSTSLSFSYSQRPNMRLQGGSTTDLTSSLTWEWNPGALSGNSVSVSPTATETYTVSATDANGCVNTETVEVTVNELPDAPIGLDSEHCGTLVPTAEVSTGGANGSGVFNWYDAPTGGNLLQTGTDATYLTAISQSTTFYVSETGTNGCESERTPVNVTVIEADPLTLTADAVTSACVGAEITLEVTQGGGNNTYEFTYSADPDAGSGITGSETGTLVSVYPTAAGTYTYTVTGTDNDKGCTNVATAIITINPLPLITAVTATPSTVCSGGDVQLAAASIPAGAGQATVGTGTGTSSTTGITPFTSNYQSNRSQYIVRASELTAAGVVPGNITALAFNITSGTTFPLVNYSVRMAHTSATALSAAFLTPTFTTVYSEASFVPGTTTGWRELTFSTPFNWDGTSNIVIDICHDNIACSGGFGVCWAGNSTVQVSTTAYNSVFARYSDTQVMCGTDGSGSALSTYTSRPNMRFGAQVGVNLTSTLTWEWNPGALSGATVTVNPTTTTTYTVSATDANGCVATDDVEVTVLDLPATPSATPSTQCGEGVPTASVSGGSGTFLWYDAPTGGNLVQTGGSTYTGTVSTSTTFYVAESDGTCESERVAVEITVNAPDPITAVAADNTICIGEDVELSVTQDGSNQTYTYTWTATPEAGSGITGSLNGGAQTITPTAAGTYVYQVAGFDPAGPCNITSTVSVTVNELPVITSATASPATICVGAISDLVAVSIPASTGNAQVGAGASTSSSSATPFYGGWGGTKVSYIYTAAELSAAGMVAGNINSIGLDVSTSVSTIFKGFAIGIATTTESVFTTAAHLPTTNVYNGPLADNGYQTTSGINTFTFSSPFYWDGTSNIVVSFCYSNTNTFNTAATVRTDTYAGQNKAVYSYADNKTPAQVCAAVTGSVDGSGGTSTSTLRAKTIFNGQVGVDLSPSLNWSWNPGGFTTNAVTVSPTTTTTYTVTATDPVTGCASVSQDVTVTVAPVTATASADVTTTCAGDPVELSVVAGGGGPFSYVWSDGTNTVGTAAEITVNPTTTTTYTVTVTDVCNNSISDQVTITVNPLPMVSIEEVGPIDICAPGTQVLTANTTTPNPEYQWQNNGTDIDGETSSTLTVTTTGNYSVLVTETSTGCVGSSTAVAVNINPLPVITSVTGPEAVCDGSSATLVAKSEFFAPGVAQLGTGTSTTSTTGTSPFSAGWEVIRTQYLVRASELQAANLAAGDINALAFFVTTGYSSIMKDYTVKISHTTATTLGTAYESGTFTTVYGPEDYASGTTSNAWRTLDFDTPFTWDGTSNLIIEICFESDPDGSCGTCYGSTSTVRYTATSYNSVYARYADNVPACDQPTFGTAQTSARTFRPNMQFSGTVVDNQTPNFSWEWNPGALTGSSVSVTPTTETTYTVVATNTLTGCVSAPQQITVDVTPALTVSADIAGPTNATAHVGSLPVATYSIATTNETSITWDIPAGSTNVTGQGTNTISFNYPIGYGGGSISVTVEGNAPCEPITRTLTITYDCPVAPVVSGPTNVCPFVGTSTEVTYTVAPDPGVSSYNWVVPPNVTIVSGQGTGSLTVTFQTGFTTQANKQIRVTGQSGCGNTAMTIYYLLTQFPSAAGPISGPTDACSFIGTSNEATYSIDPVTAAESYLWTVPAGATIVSGAGTNSINVTFDNAFVTSAITVRAVNGCGTSTPRSITVTRTAPSTPSLISGPTNACLLMPTSANPSGVPATYSVSNVSGNTYTWVVPSGVTITSGQGTNSIEVSFDGTYSGGNINVFASTSCGNSGLRSLSLTQLTPSAPVAIDVLELGACPERMIQYSLASVPSNSTYLLWTVPAGATIMSGQGTTSITVSYPSTALAGNVTVTAQNGCGNSSTRTLKVKLSACEAPPPPPPFVKDGGVKEVPALTLEVNVFPNPSTHVFNVQAKSTDMKTRVVLKVMDNLGRVMESHNMMPGETQPVGTRLKAGSYFIEVMQGNERVTKRVIKF